MERDSQRTTDGDGPTPETAVETALEMGRRGFVGAAVAGLGAAFGVGQASAADRDPTLPGILNYALTLERLEAAYYADALASSGGAFTEREVESSDVAGSFDRPTLRYSTYQQFEDIRDHERYHAEVLEDALDSLGAEVTAVSEFTFPDGVYDDVERFVSFARVVEDLGVAAYAGAAPHLAKAELDSVGGDASALELTPVALGIHSVEARHASYLRILELKRPWPFGDAADAAVDDPKTMEEVLGTIDEYAGSDATRRFTVTVENVSTPGTVDTDRANGVVPLSPPVYAVYSGENPAFAVGEPANAGTEIVAEDGFPQTLIDTLDAAENVSQSGVAPSPGGAIEGPPLGPGESVEFTVEASPGDRLTMETMFVQSSDWFYGFEGLDLFAGGSPISGDVTGHLGLYDAGTEVDAPPGHGPTEPPGAVQKPVQDPTATNVGTDEDEPIRPASERHPNYGIPDASSVIRVVVD